MAMVARKERVIELAVKSMGNAGPGSYQPNDKVVRRRSPEATIMKPLQVKARQFEQTPGPGAYAVVELGQQEKVVVSNEHEGLIVIERQKNQAVFKSTSAKLASWERSVDQPGPGHYNLKDKWIKDSKESCKNKPTAKECALESVFADFDYKPVQSIPHKWSQNRQFLMEEEGELTLLNDQIIHAGQVDRQNNQKQQCKPGSSFSKSRSNRLQPPVKQCELGPGSYFQQSQPPMRMLSRMAEQPRTGFLQLLDKHQKSACKELQQEQNSFTQDSSDLSIEYVKDANPGPGSYDISLSFGSRKNFSCSNIQRFGVTSKRFQPIKQVSRGSKFYDVRKVKSPQPVRQHQDFAIAFGRKKEEVVPAGHSPTPSDLGPGSYPEIRTLEKKIESTLKRTYQGRFGSNAKRFGDQVKPATAQHKFYDTNKDSFRKPNTASPVFRSSSPRSNFEGHKQNIEPVGFYSQKYNTIERKLEILRQDQQDEVTKKPGFNTSTVRFVEMIREKHISTKPETGEQVLTTCTKAQAYSIPAAELKPLSPAQQTPGPGQYEFLDRWNSKTFNILYI